MFKNIIKSLFITSIVFLFMTSNVSAEILGLDMKTKNFSALKQTPNETADTITRLNIGELVNILYIQEDWACIQYNTNTGFVKLTTFYDMQFTQPYIEIGSAAYIEDNSIKLPEPIVEDKSDKNNTDKNNIDTDFDLQARAAKVTFPTWNEIKSGIFLLNKPAEVYDIKSGKIYYVQSFSNGNHADVEPCTKKDTAIMFETFGKEWSWDVRPVWVTINGQTIAGSINGMPHASQTIYDNDMDGQICIHFKNSKTHNGNQSYTDLHQEIAQEAYDLALEYR